MRAPLSVFGQAIVGGTFTAVLKVMLKITALHYLGTVLSEWTGHHELVEELVDQDAGFLAVLENHRLAIHGAEVLLYQEVGEAECAVSVTTGSIQRVQQSLQADVAYEVVIHIFCVGVEVVFLRGMGLTTHHTQGCRAGVWVINRV